MLLDGSIDGFILVAGAPVKLLLDLPESASEKIHLLEFSKESLQSVRGTNLTYQKSEIPASTYSWELKPISTIVVQSVMIARADLDEKIISQFTKSIYKEKEILSTRHEKWKSLNKDTLSNLFKRNPDLFHSSIKLKQKVTGFYAETTVSFKPRRLFLNIE
jgi:TRAP-type uncharacterized transport system substrate-binding protein